MTTITKQDTIIGVRRIPELASIGKYLMFMCADGNGMDEEHGDTLLGEIGKHSFGLGTNTDVEGWVERAAAFEQSL